MNTDSPAHEAYGTQGTHKIKLDPSQEKALIIDQLQKLILQHFDDVKLKVELNKIIEAIANSASNTPLLDFKNAIRSDQYLISDSLKKSLLNFVEMELRGLAMETVNSRRLRSQKILDFIQEGHFHAQKAKNLDIVIFIGNTGSGKSTLINALEGCKMVWGKYFPDPTGNTPGRIKYLETLLNHPEIKKLADSKRMKITEIIDKNLNDGTTTHGVIDAVIKQLERWNIDSTPQIKKLTEKLVRETINASRRSRVDDESNVLSEVIIVDKREGNKPPVASIGHKNFQSHTFYPEIICGDLITYCDCPGFLEAGKEENLPKEREIANSVNIMQTVAKARTVRVVITINYNEIKAGRGARITDLRLILEGLFGDWDNVLKHKKSILINISHVPKIKEAGYQNSVAGLCSLLREDRKLIPLLEQVVIIYDLMDKSQSKGTKISLSEFAHKIQSLQPIRYPQKIFRTAMSEKTSSALELFATDAENEIIQKIKSHDFECAYNKFHYLMQLSYLKYALIDQKIQQIKTKIAQELHIVYNEILTGMEANELDILAKQLYKGILLDRLIGADIAKDAYFKTKLLLLKFLLKKPIFQRELIDQHIEDIYCMMNSCDVPSWPSMIQVFIDDLFFKGNEVAIFPNMEKKAQTLFDAFEGYFRANQKARYGVMTVDDFKTIAQLTRMSQEDIFALLKKAGWLDGKEGSTEASIAISEQKLLSLDIQVPSELNTNEVKKELMELFEKRLLIDMFFAKKFLKFKEGQELSKSEVVTNMVKTIGSKIDTDKHKRYQIKNLLAQYFSSEKATRYLEFLYSLKLLAPDLVSKRYKLLEKIIKNFKVLNDTLDETSSHVPVGSVHMIPSNHVPSGFKKCDGQWLSVNAYAALYHVIRNTFGEQETPQGEKQFRLPDYRGFFLRGTTQNRFFNALENDTTRLPRAAFFTSYSGDHAHLGNTSINGNHIHDGGTSLDGIHHHAMVNLSYSVNNILRSGSDYKLTSLEYWDTKGFPTSVEGGHTHTLNITAAGDHNHTLNITANGNHMHTISGGDPETRPQNYPVTYMMKY